MSDGHIHPTEPQGLDPLLDFVNTRDIERHRDALGTPALMRNWLTARGALEPGGIVTAEAHARALAIREGIRALAGSNNDGPMDLAAVTAMNEAAAAIPLVVALRPSDDGGAWSLSPRDVGADAFVGHMLASVAASMADGSWSRMKACRNDTCRWLFHDRSRNRSGTWCTMAVCGSRMKARAYRARQRESASA